jgi:hypothetical protein
VRRILSDPERTVPLETGAFGDSYVPQVTPL